MTTVVSQPVKCTCCGQKVIAELVKDCLLFRKRINGEWHFFKLKLTESTTSYHTEHQTTE